jgi:pimeloyl-ACP methyl ester carboxylesterase
MPVVFVHGNPDTRLLWEPLEEYLDDQPDEKIAVDLPGFATPAPAGFRATKEAYVEWLVSQLEAVAERAGRPVDLVGHDWGSLLAQRVASTRPDLLRSLAVGGAAIDAEYEWHPHARIWQAPGQGERNMAERLMLDAGIAYLIENGVPERYARRNSWLVPGNIACVLRLYRSAVRIGEEWQPDLERVDLPAVVIWGRTDQYVPLVWGERLATRIGAELVSLDCGHWWPYQRPRETAEALIRLWSTEREDL